MDKPLKNHRSFHSFVLIIAVAILIFPKISFAYYSAPLKPVYLSAGNSPKYCSSIFTVISDTPQKCNSQFLGYVFTAEQPGTVPIYISAANSPKYCSTLFSLVSNTAQKCNSQFLGYVFTTQQPGTVPIYISAAYSAKYCGTGFSVISNTPQKCNSKFIGYVFPKIPAPTTSTVWPKYYIGSVIYVPPGAGTSSITYGANTVTGTTVSTKESWSYKSNLTGVSIGIFDISFGDSFGGSTTNSVDMQRTSSQSEVYKAPPSDTINHDYDVIRIYLGVKVNIAVDYLGEPTWSVDFSQIANQGYAANGYNIAVGCLRANSTVPAANCASTLSLLDSAGITPDDYPSILGADPYADPAAATQTPDVNRYVMIDAVSYIYQPTITTFSYNENNSTTYTNSTTTSYSYSVGYSSSFTVFDTGLKSSSTFTWTNESTTSNKTGSTSTSAFTLSNPSASYPGPYTLFVYMDTIYKTFMFSFY